MAFTESSTQGNGWDSILTVTSYGERLRGKSVPFTLVMEVEGNGVMKGHILDDGYADSIDARATDQGCDSRGCLSSL